MGGAREEKEEEEEEVEVEEVGEVEWIAVAPHLGVHRSIDSDPRFLPAHTRSHRVYMRTTNSTIVKCKILSFDAWVDTQHYLNFLH